MGAARKSAQAHAAKGERSPLPLNCQKRSPAQLTQNAPPGGITCPPSAMHYSCHLAPWGYQSHDQSEYMHWCGSAPPPTANPTGG
jgi:hypothetical protein